MIAFILTMVIFLTNGHVQAEAEAFPTMEACREAEADVDAKIKADATIQVGMTRCEAIERPQATDEKSARV